MTTKPDFQNSSVDSLRNIQFSDLFILEDIQHLQDLFADAHGIASIITAIDGQPITRPSNFTQLCGNIIRKTEKGRANCFKSDAAIGKKCSSGPIIQPCMSCGLWDAGASITVAGKHIANWLIGQVRNEKVSESQMIQYADEIGAKRVDFLEAFHDVPAMSLEKFEKVARLLFAYANELSEKAYNNLQLKLKIEENEKTVKLLQESEERFQTLFNKAPLGYQSLDSDGKFIEVNHKWLDTLGYTHQEVIGKWFGDFLSPMYQEGFRKRFPIFKAQGHIHSEFEMVHKNGKKLFIAFDGKIGYDLNGKFQQTHCILQDITERKKSENALIESEERYRTVVSNTPVVTFVTDDKGIFSLSEGMGLAKLGLKPGQIVGRSVFDVYRDFPTILEALKKALGGVHQRYEVMVQGIVFDVFYSPVFDQHGKVVKVIGVSNDITERIKAEEALVKSEEKYRKIFENVQDVFYQTNMDGIFIEVSPSIEHYTGFRQDEIIGSNVNDFYYDLNDRIHVLDTILKNGEIKDYELKLKIQSGEIKYGSINARLFFDAQGQPSYISGAIRDVTERKLAVLALKESEDRYRSFISQVSEGVYRLESDLPMDIGLPVEEQVDFIYDHMFIAECNDAFLKMYGITDRKDVIGKGHLDFHGGRHNVLNRSLLKEFINNGYTIQNGITEEKNTTGKLIYISNNSLGIIQNNHLVRVWGTQIDITEKVRSDRVQQVLYAISLAALSSKDMDELTEIISLQLGKLLDTNNFYIAFYDETNGMLSTHFLNDQKDEITCWPAEMSATGYVIKRQKSLLANDTDMINLCEAGEIEIIGVPAKVWLGVPLWAKKKVIGAIVVQSYDNADAYTEKDQLMLEFISHQIGISIERKKAEQELKEAILKAQESDRLKSAFLANMSHEIRTPMNGILGFAGLLKEPDLTEEEHEEYIQIIENSGARMLNIINDIMSISKVESGQMEITISETNLNDQMKYIYTFFKPEVEGKGMKFTFKNALPDNNAVIKTDKEKVYAILTNLVKNAIKFTKSGSIEFGYSLKSGIEEKELEFYVKDTGMGIPEDQQGFIFDRFRQGSESLNRNYEGTGLGLAISKAYVEMLGGRIWVESKVGKGSGFYFTLPFNRERKVPEIKNNISLLDVKSTQIGSEIFGLKVLIAEDDEGSAMLIAMAINGFSKAIIKVRTGIEAVEACRNHPDIDLILMDIKMPEMDGFEATRQIRQFNKDVIIIAQTAYALTGDREKTLAIGCNDYIAKPIQKDQFIVLIEKYFKKQGNK